MKTYNIVCVECGNIFDIHVFEETDIGKYVEWMYVEIEEDDVGIYSGRCPTCGKFYDDAMVKMMLSGDITAFEVDHVSNPEAYIRSVLYHCKDIKRNVCGA